MGRRRVLAKYPHICEICGKFICKRQPCYRVDDDFMAGMAVYEHICCDKQIAKAAERKRERASWEGDGARKGDGQ